MRRPPIPMNALRAFEAAARNGSVKLAADELSVSPSAVSHQVRQLETILGSNLFVRDGRGVTLSDDGAQLFPKLSKAFGLIDAALDEHRKVRIAGPLRISVLETFAHWWLLPRLGSYPLAQQGFELDIQTSPRTVSFENENIDAAIRIGNGHWPSTESTFLFAERLGIYASASVVPESEDRPLFLSRYREAEWRAWCDSPSPPSVAHLPTVLVESASLGLKAALDGVGLCLAGDAFAASQVASGRLTLIELCPPLRARARYWLVYPNRMKRDLRLRNFRSWLSKQVDAPDTPDPA